MMSIIIFYFLSSIVRMLSAGHVACVEEVQNS